MTENGTDERRCPSCESLRLRLRSELDAEEKLIFDRMPASAEYTKKEREQHLYCSRCGFESSGWQPSAA
ncbi:MAG: hypothetical protein IPM21_00850 [Acidobacteria bacterium]|nr:hypothetical protein [Acidobacteriota bacterium]